MNTLRLFAIILGFSPFIIGCEEDKQEVIDQKSEYFFEQAFPGVKGELQDFIINEDTITVEKIGDKNVFQGDIILTEDQLKTRSTKGAGLFSIAYRWVDNTIYYTINEALQSTNTRIIDAIGHYKEKTSLKFVERTNQANYVEFIWDRDGCYSYLGMIGGKQVIGLADWGNAGTVIHEMGHTIGLIHEQSRSDRDQYVIIYFENILAGKGHNFTTSNTLYKTPLFDFSSIMLYSSYAFSSNGLPTITKLDGSTFNANREDLSEDDINIINLIYGNFIYTAPTVSTKAITEITQTGALSGGIVTSDGGSEVFARGICWSTGESPTIDGTGTTDGYGKGSYTSVLTQLNPNTLYFVRAYATNRTGTGYGNEINFTSSKISIATLTTIEVSMITQTTAVSGGDIISDGGFNIIQRGVCWSTSTNPTISDLHTSDGMGTGYFISNLTDLNPNTLYYLRSYAINSEGTAYGNQISFTTIPNVNGIIFNPNLVYGSISDNDGNIYKTIQISSQIWMAENLKTTKYNDGSSIPNVTDNTEWSLLTSGAYSDYNNTPSNNDIYGKLYNWYAVNTNKLCPTGWHVPSEDEWFRLNNYLGIGDHQGGKLKEIGTTHWTSPNNGATNETGFTGLPSGYRPINGTYTSLGYYGWWWSSSEIEPSSIFAYSANIGNVDNDMTYFSASTKEDGYAIRCLKD
jgi:uncharacterized protein (TIGR02145 family)